MTPSSKPPDPYAEAGGEGGEGTRCYVCETDLTEKPGEGGRDKKQKQKHDGEKEGHGKEKGLPKRGLVEIRSEGTGFAGGGKNMAKREGVAFQC